MTILQLSSLPNLCPNHYRGIRMPYISCVTTLYNDKESARISIESILNQSFEDFELILVDDGADETTREVARSYCDSRIVYIRQSNDGLSSARNRGLQHCKGEYICFLDADDMRPFWAFEEMADTARSSNADCIFSRGSLIELRKESFPFYDDPIFDMLLSGEYEDDLDKALPLLMLLEPQSANKLVKRSFLKENNLTFPNGLFFEDMLFHMGLVARLKSYELVDKSCFTYFRRYGKKQITSTATTTRFDALSTGFMTLEAFEMSPRFQNVELRLALVLGMFKLIKWCDESISHRHKYHFSQILKKKLHKLNPLYIESLNYLDRNIFNSIDYKGSIELYITKNK